MKKIIFALLVFIAIKTYGQQPYDHLTIENINRITVLEFSSIDAYEKLVHGDDIEKLKSIFYLTIQVSVNNIVNSTTTRTMAPNSPYRYKYVFVNELLEYDILEKDLFRYIFDPTHPDTIHTGEMTGYVKYPDIDIFKEQNNIELIINMLFLIK